MTYEELTNVLINSGIVAVVVGAVTLPLVGLSMFGYWLSEVIRKFMRRKQK